MSAPTLSPAVNSPPPDIPTLIAMAAVAGALAALLHEGLGHGGACVLSGGHNLLICSVSEECSVANHWIDAAGSLVNWAAGLACFWGMRRVRSSSSWRYFLWLLMAFNLFAAAGYWLFSGAENFGDWALVIHARQPAWLWRAGLVAAGGAAYVLCVWVALRELRPWLRAAAGPAWRRARTLSLVPYIAYGTLACLAGALNPEEPRLIVLSAAAASFGGASGLAWMWEYTRNPSFVGASLTLAGPRLSPAWIAAGVVVAALFIFVLGPGLRP